MYETAGKVLINRRKKIKELLLLYRDNGINLFVIARKQPLLYRDNDIISRYQEITVHKKKRKKSMAVLGFHRYEIKVLKNIFTQFKVTERHLKTMFY